jgi:catechol 2,3-dioxygenase-like lactoylglutathione lyase family enzyme
MIDHLSIGVSDVAASGRFYDAVLAPLGYRRLYDSADALGYGATDPVLWVQKSEHPVPADPRSGLHICFAAPDRGSVEAFHRAALSTSGKDNGKPGHRPDYGADYYAAFVMDPDGYRIEAHCHVPA